MKKSSFRRVAVSLFASLVFAIAPAARAQNTFPYPSVITVGVADSSAAEPGTNTALFMVSRSGPTNTDLVVFFTMSGAAVNGTDYEFVDGSVMIHCNAKSAYVMIRPLDDTLQEAAEPATLTVATNCMYLVGAPSSASVNIGDNDNLAPTAAITSPARGSSFLTPTNIVIEATAADSDGMVQRVEFYANSMLIGTDTNAPFAATWMNPFPGSYSLQAKAVDNLGAYGWSTTLPVTVQSLLPLVTVAVSDTSAAEPGTNTASFTIVRTGDTNSVITVNYRITGTASNGVDYELLPGSVSFAAGARYATVLVRPLDDTLLEPLETVTLTLLTNGIYLIGSPNYGTATIADNDNTPPTVTIISPITGSSYNTPATIPLEATANDSDGSIRRVEFWANSVMIGSRTSAPYAVTWVNAPAGTNKITAKACDNLESVGYSPAVTVLVHSVVLKPELTLLTLDCHASEPGTDTALIQVTRDGDTNASLTVYYRVEGTASNGADYVALPGSVTVPAGSRAAFIQIRPIDDTLLEGTESVVLSLVSNSTFSLGCHAYAAVSIQDNEECSNARPVVAITAPTAASIFTAPTNIVISANATDSDGEILRVEFWANNIPVGIATGAPYSVTWHNPQPGGYRLIARAVDNKGLAGYSAPVEISVRSPITRPMVGVKTVDGHASEPGTNTALFQIIRSTCDTSTALTVTYRMEGTALNGADYQQLPGTVTIPAGAHYANVLVRPLDDTIVEQPERVVIILTQAAPTGANLGYSICVTSAVAYIADNDIATNLPPAIAIASPTNGASFQLPASITIDASASDSDGTIASVEIFADGASLGVFPSAPYTVTLTNLTEGYHDLTASATDDKGATTLSSPVTIQILAAPLPVLATRQLPNVYVPGVKHPVKIAVTPLTGTASYTIEDMPPDGWEVLDVNDGGTYDPATHTVTFTLTGDAQQQLHYKIKSPDADTGEKCFTGIMRIGTATSDIGGDLCISTPPGNSADSAPAAATSSSLIAGAAAVTADSTIADTANTAADFVMTKAEVDAYELTWRTTCRARIAPNPVPLGYLTRAAHLWASGQNYTFCTNETPPFAPMIWVPLAQAAPRAPWSASGEGHGSAYCFMPTNHEPGVPFTVTIAVTPAPGTTAFAIQERAPEGWTISNISDGGSWCPISHSIKFGLFYGDLPRTLTFTITAPAGTELHCAKFAGVASFDGVNVPLTGARCCDCDRAPADHEQHQPPHHATEHLFNFTGTPGQCYRIEATADFIHWTKVQDLLDSDGTPQNMDPDAHRHGQRSYRILPLAPSPIP